MGPRWCKLIGAILSGPSALLFLVSHAASFVFHLNILPSIPSFYIVISVFLLFSFFLGWLNCWLNLLAYFLGSWSGVDFLASKNMALFAGG